MGRFISKEMDYQLANQFLNCSREYNMHWFEEHHVFKEENEQRLAYWKREMDDIFFVWRGTKDELEEFVWHLNGVEFKIKFTLNHEENGFIAFLDVGITRKDGQLVTNFYRNLHTHNNTSIGIQTIQKTYC